MPTVSPPHARPRTPVRRGKLALALAATGLALSSAPGCGPAEPRVDPNAPQVRAAATPDVTGARPKGMPKNTTAGLRLDAATGRPVPQQ